MADTEPLSLDEARRVLEATLGMPFSQGNKIDVLRNGVEIFPAMLDAIEQAQRSIEFLTFIYWTGDIARRFAHALSERARAGVKVRVILDALGAAEMSQELTREMEAAGVEVVWFRPVKRWKVWEVDNRTHRKLLIVDGRVGFTGGVGIAKEWEGDARNPSEWRDSHFRIQGPAVHGLQAAFIGNWAETGRAVTEDVACIVPQQHCGESLVQVLRATASVHWSDIASMIHILLCLARRRVRIATAYFVPDDTSLRLLSSAVERGVEVEIMIPGPYNDHRICHIASEDRFLALLESGVKIWTYQTTMMHTKVITVDGLVASVGSPNFNQRSMSKDDEVALVVLDRELTATLDGHFDEDLRRAAPMRADELQRPGLARRVLRKGADLFRGEL